MSSKDVSKETILPSHVVEEFSTGLLWHPLKWIGPMIIDQNNVFLPTSGPDGL